MQYLISFDYAKVQKYGFECIRKFRSTLSREDICHIIATTILKLFVIEKHVSGFENLKSKRGTDYSYDISSEYSDMIFYENVFDEYEEEVNNCKYPNIDDLRKKVILHEIIVKHIEKSINNRSPVKIMCYYLVSEETYKTMEEIFRL